MFHLTYFLYCKVLALVRRLSLKKNAERVPMLVYGNRLSRALVPLVMTTFQAIIDTVLLCSMGLGGLSGVGRSKRVDSA